MTRLRDQRLRKTAESDRKNNQFSLAIPSGKEVFVRKGEYNGFSKSHIRGEQIFRQHKFDELRMDQLTDQMLALRKKDDKQQATIEATVEKPSKSKIQDKEQLAMQQKITVNRLAMSKDSLQKQAAQEQHQYFNNVMQTTAIMFPNARIAQSSSSSKRKDITNSGVKQPLSVQAITYMSPSGVSQQT